MDNQNAPAPAEAQSALSMISSLRAESAQTSEQPTTNTQSPAETPAPSAPAPSAQTPAPAPAPAPTTQTPAPAPAPTPEETQAEAEAEARRVALLREIAVNPALTQQYTQQQFYQQPQQQQAPQQFQQYQYQQQQPLAPSAPQLPFGEFDFDPSNPEHQAALIAHQIQQVGAPLFDEISQITNRFKAEEQAKQAQQFQEVINHANQTTVNLLDTYVPGFSAIAAKANSTEPWTAQEEALFNIAANLESQIFQDNPYAVYDVQARAQIAQHIGPIIKQKAKELGLVAQPRANALNPQQQEAMRREMYVESSNAVPTSSAGNFEKAHAKKDTLGMIRALRT